jgi:hypothetical protein
MSELVAEWACGELIEETGTLRLVQERRQRVKNIIGEAGLSLGNLEKKGVTSTIINSMDNTYSNFVAAAAELSDA